MSASGARHAFLPHTGEVKLELEAPTREALFAQAGEGLAELMLGDAFASRRTGAPARFELEARDGPALLVRWLNELISRGDVEKRVFTVFEVSEAGERSLRALAWAQEPAALKTAVKAATLHGVTVERSAAGWHAAVILDV